jgi:hypothetical protein
VGDNDAGNRNQQQPRSQYERTRSRNFHPRA